MVSGQRKREVGGGGGKGNPNVHGEKWRGPYLVPSALMEGCFFRGLPSSKVLIMTHYLAYGWSMHLNFELTNHNPTSGKNCSVLKSNAC